MSIPIPHQIVTQKGYSSIVCFVPGTPAPLQAAQDHPNYGKIVAAALAGKVQGFVDLFDVSKAIERRFRQLSERVSVANGHVYFDGDEVNGTLEDQILEFVDADEDFGPLVRFYEKLTTNPLGDVRKGIYDWIVGQRKQGALTITPDGNLLGYKSVTTTGDGYRPSQASRNGGDRVNGVEVPAGKYIVQRPGDVVEMPRSKVLHAPSQYCGDGLHIGTYAYAKGFQGDTVLLVEFNPRDVVSLPDSNAGWKLRVCRYKVIKPVTEPLNVPVFAAAKSEDDKEHDFIVKLVGRARGAQPSVGSTRQHGKGGPTAAHGTGRHPAQDDLGRFSSGRPGSQRDGLTGRFA